MVCFGRRAVLGGVAALAAAPAFAQGYPDKPIRLVVPAGAGGPTDVVARILQPHPSQILRPTIVVENKAGASGNIGSGVGAPAPAGGPPPPVGPPPQSPPPAPLRQT